MRKQKKLLAYDTVKNPLSVGDEIMYITGSHSFTVVNYGTIEKIYYPTGEYYKHFVKLAPHYKVKKTAEIGGYTNPAKFPVNVTLTNPLMFKTGIILRKPK